MVNIMKSILASRAYEDLTGGLLSVFVWWLVSLIGSVLQEAWELDSLALHLS